MLPSNSSLCEFIKFCPCRVVTTDLPQTISPLLLASLEPSRHKHLLTPKPSPSCRQMALATLHTDVTLSHVSPTSAEYTETTTYIASEIMFVHEYFASLLPFDDSVMQSSKTRLTSKCLHVCVHVRTCLRTYHK